MNISTEDFDYESLPTTSLGINMTAGAIAGVLEHTVMYPLDSVKTRMQSLLPKVSGYDITTTFRNMVNKEGLMRPIRGLTAVVAGAGPAHALHFASYEFTKELVTNVTTFNHLNYIISGAVATLIHDAVSNPTEVIKQRMQMYNSPYKSVIACMLGVYRTEGIKAFYRSYATQLFMNVPHQAIQFTTYEFFQNLLNHERKYNPPVHVVAGGAAGACAAAITTPLDVVKTLLNTQETGFTKGMVDAIQQIHSVAGPRGFFKGLTARVLYSMPATAICWSTYEFFKFYLCGFEHDQYKSSITGKNQLQARETEFESAVAAASGVITAGEDNDHAYVLPSPPSVDASMSKSSTSHVATTAVSAVPSATTLSSSTVTSSLPTPAPAPPSSASIKTVCELTASVATPTLNLNTRHSEMKQPFDRGFSSQ